MDFKAKYDGQIIKDGKYYLSFEIEKDALQMAEKLRELKDKELSLGIGIYRNKRSLNANAYMWELCQKIAESPDIKSSKDEIYLKMLQRYGVFTHGIFKPKAAERVKQQWRTVIDLGEVTVNGSTGIQLQLYYGSSTYDTKEMSVLINGIVDECKELNIETLPETEIKSLCEEWNNEQKNKSDKHKRKSKAGSNRT